MAYVSKHSRPQGQSKLKIILMLKLVSIFYPFFKIKWKKVLQNNKKLAFRGIEVFYFFKLQDVLMYHKNSDCHFCHTLTSCLPPCRHSYLMSDGWRLMGRATCPQKNNLTWYKIKDSMEYILKCSWQNKPQ